MQSAWFQKKEYGYGWVPTTWQGWSVMWVYVGAIIAAGAYFSLDPSPESLIRFTIWIVICTVVMFAVCRAHTPPI